MYLAIEAALQRFLETTVIRFDGWLGSKRNGVVRDSFGAGLLLPKFPCAWLRHSSRTCG